MERKSPPTHPGLIGQLAPYVAKINFYRFCQLVEQAMPAASGLGSDSHLRDEPVRFHPHSGMGFPVNELKTITYDSEHPTRPPRVSTQFLGLYGVESPLPSCYIDDIAQQQEGSEAVSDFLDIFNHRLTTQFYRIWRKYSYPASFVSGGKDETSQYLLGLVGLGIPGTEKQIGAPISRFLALLGTLRLPTRTAEGVSALVSLLSCHTRAEVCPHDMQKVYVGQPVQLSEQRRVTLQQRPVLGNSSIDVNSQLLLKLHCEDRDEIEAWLPGGPLLQDLMALLHVYLGARYQVRLQLVLPREALADAQLHVTPPPLAPRLGLTAVMRGTPSTLSTPNPQTLTLNLGRYQGLIPNPHPFEASDGNYRF